MLVFRQLFDATSSTYTYLLADSGQAVLIDPVFEQHARDAALVRELGLEGKRIAVERNGAIVPKSRYADTPLAEGDRLEIVGAVGGLLVVPLNALLQHRGCTLLSAGRSIAVQGFNENASVLGMLALYTTLVALDVPIVTLLWAFGLCIAAAIAALMHQEQRRSRRASAVTGTV